MDREEISLKITSLMRHAGIDGVPRPMAIGLVLLTFALVMFCLWQFWPRPSADFVATQAQAEASTQDEDQAEASSEVAIDVEGAVVAPGLYLLPENARAKEAIDAAGGLSADALPGGINLAQKLSDGDQIIVPRIEDSEGVASLPTGQITQQGPSGKININTAGSEELQQLSGVGPSLSERIIQYRQANGRFKAIEDIQNVSGIGETRFQSIKDRICV